MNRVFSPKNDDYESMAGHVSSRWNQIYPSLVQLAERLEALGFYYDQGEVCVVETALEVEDDIRPL
jgi:hypothetical protein